jgi:hypothetical protein
MNTRGSALLLGAAALALLAHVSTALGAGKITGLTLSLPAIRTCAVETVTVRGTGKCCIWSVHYGDGGAVIALGPKACLTFPHTFQHAYSKLGTYTVTAEGYNVPGSTCTGKASATVQVAAGPTITSVFALGFSTPGALTLLRGENFGDLPGQVVIHVTDWQGNLVEAQLQNLQWGDTYVAGTVPAITGVPDLEATITVVAQCGAPSNTLQLHFTAARDVADLAYPDPNPKPVNRTFECSISTGSSASDACENLGGDTFPEECGCCAPWNQGPQSSLPNLVGYHASGWGSGNGGNDQFRFFPALNWGWVLDSTSVDWTTMVNNGGTVSVDGSLTTNSPVSNPRLGVDWNVNACGGIFYLGHMIITGPAGVPF